MTYRNPAYSTDNYSPEPTPRPDWVPDWPVLVNQKSADRQALAKARKWARRTFVVSAIAFGVLGFFAGRASAAPQCDARDGVVWLLADKYGETVRSMGIAGESAVMELYASDATGTWTITVTLADGQMCLMASGIGFTAATPGEPA